MAVIIRSYQSQAPIRTGGAAGAGRARSAEAFTGGVDRAMPGALNAFAQGLDKLNRAVFDVEIERRRELMELELLQDMQRYRSGMDSADDAFMRQFRGKDAMGAEEQAAARYGESLDALLKKWEGNRFAQNYLQRQGGALGEAGVKRMRDYRNKQQEVVFGETVQGQMALAGRMALDPRYSAEEADEARRKAENLNIRFHLRRGLPAERAVAENMENRRKAALAQLDMDVGAYLEQGDIAGANAAMERVLRDQAAIGGKEIRYGSSDEQTRKSAFNRPEGEGAGLIGAADVRILQDRIEKSAEKIKSNNAFNILKNIPMDEAVGLLTSTEGRKRFGLSGKQADNVAEMLSTRETCKRRAEKEARDAAAAEVMTNAVNLALGANGLPADPVTALQMIRDNPHIDGRTKLESTQALKKGTINSDDPYFVTDIKERMVNGEPVSDTEVARGIATGKLSLATKDRISQLREEMAGPRGGLIKYATNAIKEAFKADTLISGTPELAMNKYSALRELDLVIQEGTEKGDLMERLDPTSKKFALPGIIQRNKMSFEDRMKVVANRYSSSTDSEKFKAMDDYLEKQRGGRK